MNKESILEALNNSFVDSKFLYVDDNIRDPYSKLPCNYNLLDGILAINSESETEECNRNELDQKLNGGVIITDINNLGNIYMNLNDMICLNLQHS